MGESGREGPEQRGLANILEDMHSALRELERGVAGYVTLSRALNAKPDDKMRKGPPIMSFTGSIDGVHALEIVSDMSRAAFEKTHLAHALVPHINAFSVDMCAANQKLVLLAGEMEQRLSQTQPG